MGHDGIAIESRAAILISILSQLDYVIRAPLLNSLPMLIMFLVLFSSM